MNPKIEPIRKLFQAKKPILLYGIIENVCYQVTKGKVTEISPDEIDPNAVCLTFTMGQIFDNCGYNVTVPDVSTCLKLLEFFSKDLVVPLKRNMLDIPMMRFKHLHNE